MVRRTVQLLQEFSIPLLAGVLVAIVWANVDHGSYEALLHASPLPASFPEVTFHFVVNELFMTFFFAVATKEIAEACLPGGALNPVKNAINPIVATCCGVVGPALVYLAWSHATGDRAIAQGWGIPTATDIALAWLVARVAFGKSHPAVSFLLLLAIADDGIGLAIIAIFYPDPAHPVQPIYLGLVAVAMGIAYALRGSKTYSPLPYLVAGALSWAGLYLAHLHPALAMVFIVPFMPHSGRDRGLFVDDDAWIRANTMGRFERSVKKPVDLGLFFFGIANAGVTFSDFGNATYAVLAGLAIGKTVGVALGALGARAAGFPLPTGMHARDVVPLGMNAALGLTVALFVAGVAFPAGSIQGAAKMGALLSALMGPITILTARMFGIKPLEARPEDAAQRAEQTDG